MSNFSQELAKLHEAGVGHAKLFGEKDKYWLTEHMDICANKKIHFFGLTSATTSQSQDFSKAVSKETEQMNEFKRRYLELIKTMDDMFR